MKVVWHKNVRVYPVTEVGAQEAYAVYYELATGAFSEEGLPILDVSGDEIRESFIRVAPKIWHAVPCSGRVRKPDLQGYIFTP